MISLYLGTPFPTPALPLQTRTPAAEQLKLRLIGPIATAARQSSTIGHQKSPLLQVAFDACFAPNTTSRMRLAGLALFQALSALPGVFDSQEVVVVVATLLRYAPNGSAEIERGALYETATTWILRYPHLYAHDMSLLESVLQFEQMAFKCNVVFWGIAGDG